MLVEGVYLQFTISKNSLRYFGRYRSRIISLNHVIGWLIPFVIVLISATIGFTNGNYMLEKMPDYGTVYESNFTDLSELNYDSCWLSTTSNVRPFSVLLPLTVILFLNTCFAVRTAIFVIKLKKQTKNMMPTGRSCRKLHAKNQIMSGLKTIFFLTPVLGLLWFLYFLAGIANVA